MRDTYAKASSYADRGTVKSEFSGDATFTSELRFETAFVRGSRFRFEYRERLRGRELRYVIWSDLHHTYVDRSFTPAIEDVGPNVDLALAGAAGVSHGTSSTVP